MTARKRGQVWGTLFFIANITRKLTFQRLIHHVFFSWYSKFKLLDMICSIRTLCYDFKYLPTVFDLLFTTTLFLYVLEIKVYEEISFSISIMVFNKICNLLRCQTCNKLKMKFGSRHANRKNISFPILIVSS